MNKDPHIFLQHVLESIDAIEKYAHGLNKEDFIKNTQVQDAVMRRLEIIGEAVKKLPLDFQAKHPETPWRQIAGMRDVLIHGYFGVDIELVWNVLKNDLPVLKKHVQGISQEI